MTTLKALYETADALLERMRAEDRDTIKDITDMMERLDRMEANIIEEINTLRQCAQTLLDGKRAWIAEAIGAPEPAGEPQQMAAE